MKKLNFQVTSIKLQNRSKTRWHTLSKREQQVARLTAQGANMEQIGDELAVSPSTVKTHLKHIYAKLLVQSRVQLTNLVRDVDS